MIDNDIHMMLTLTMTYMQASLTVRSQEPAMEMAALDQN